MRATIGSGVLAIILIAVAAALGAVAGASTLLVWAAPFVLAIGIGLGVAVWRTPVVGAVVVVAFVPALSGLARGLAVPGLKVSEVLLMVCVAALLLRRPRRWRAASGADLALLAFALVAVGFAVYHSSDGSSELESVLRVGLQPTFLLMTWWVASRGVERTFDLVVVLRWLLVVSVVPALLTIMQYFAVPGVNETLISLTADGVLSPEARLLTDRATGPFPIWHSLGGYLLIPVTLGAVLFLRGDRRVLSRGWLTVVLLVDLSALVLAVTITLLIWLPIAFLVAAALARQLTRAVALVLVIALGAFAAFPQVLLGRVEAQSTQTEYTQGGVLPQTVEYRILVWQRDYLPLFDSAAAAGLGNDLPDDVVFESTENQYITLALRGGLGLVLLALVALGALTVRALRHARAPDEWDPHALPGPSVARSAAQASLGILVFLPAGMLMWPYLTNAGMSQALFAFAGAALAIEPRRLSRFAAATLHRPDRGTVPTLVAGSRKTSTTVAAQAPGGGTDMA